MRWECGSAFSSNDERLIAQRLCGFRGSVPTEACVFPREAQSCTLLKCYKLKLERSECDNKLPTARERSERTENFQLRRSRLAHFHFSPACADAFARILRWFSARTLGARPQLGGGEGHTPIGLRPRGCLSVLLDFHSVAQGDTSFRGHKFTEAA